MGKAEFAADLNNLSNRMAQLENSLDAKIDSLVSSYLTRNGIWNGAKQTVSLGKLRYNMLELYSAETSAVPLYYLDSSVEKRTANFFVYDLGEKKYSKDFQIVNEVNKSGLCTVEYVYAMNSHWGQTYTENTINWYNTDGADLLNYTLYTDTQQSGSGCMIGVRQYREYDYSNWCWQTSMAFFVRDSGTKTYKNNRNFTTTLSSDYGHQQHTVVTSALGVGRPYNYSPVTQSMMEPQLFLDTFFVSKGEAICCEFIDVWSGRELSTYCFFEVSQGTAAILRCLQINNIYVY